MQRSTALLFALALAGGAPAQNLVDTTAHASRVRDVFVMPGGWFESISPLSVDDWRKLSPGSELLYRDLNDHAYYPGRRASASGAFSTSVALRLGHASSAGRSGPYLRVGFDYVHRISMSGELRKETRTPSDTLTSSQTGQIIAVDSVITSTYHFDHSHHRVAIDASLIFIKEYAKHWSLHGGAGLMMGYAFGGHTSVTHTVGRRVDPSIASGTGNNQHDVRAPLEREEIRTGDDIYAALYVPLGVGYRINVKRAFWRSLNLTYEMRPTICFGGTPELRSTMRVGVEQMIGLRIDLLK